MGVGEAGTQVPGGVTGAPRSFVIPASNGASVAYSSSTEPSCSGTLWRYVTSPCKAVPVFWICVLKDTPSILMSCGNDSKRPAVLPYSLVAMLLAWLLTLPPASSVLAPMVAYCCAVAALRLPPSAAARCWPTAAPVATAAANGRPAASAWAAAPAAFTAPNALPKPACEPVTDDTTGRRRVE